MAELNPADVSASRGRFALLGRGSAYNLLSFTVPLVVAVVATPYVLGGYGSARFGLLTLLWLLVGYLSVFDLGLGRAATRFVSEMFEAQRPREVPLVTWTALVLTGFVGLGLAVVMQLVVAPLANVLIAGSDIDPVEAETVLRWAFWSVPLLMLMAVARGVLEAEGRFGAPSAARMVLALAVFVVPAVTLVWSRSLVPPIVIVVLLRLCATLLLTYLVIGHSALPRFSRTWVRLLAKYGGWITLGNVLTPTLIYGDRVAIAAVLGASAVAYYAPPFEIVNRLLLIPTALITVLFPALSRAFPAGRLKEVRMAFEESIELVGLLFVPLLAVLLANAETGLSLWLGKDYAAVALVPLQLLTVGILFQAGGVIATAVLQASPAFAIPSRIQLVLLLPYFFSLVPLTAAYGLVGAAFAWSSRSVIEASLLIAQVRRTAGPGVAVEKRSVTFLLLAAIVGVLAGKARLDARPVLSLVAGCALAVTWFRYVLAERTQLIVTTGLRKQLLSEEHRRSRN